jgi:hypothetical protein
MLKALLRGAFVGLGLWAAPFTNAVMATAVHGGNSNPCQGKTTRQYCPSKAYVLCWWYVNRYASTTAPGTFNNNELPTTNACVGYTLCYQMSYPPPTPHCVGH